MLPSLSTCLPLRLFFFNDTATTEIYTLSLHDALPILNAQVLGSITRLTVRAERAMDMEVRRDPGNKRVILALGERAVNPDRKSTRLNSSHSQISYAVFCLKKKNKHRVTDNISKQSTNT